MGKVLFFKNNNSTFVQKDEDVIRECFECRSFLFHQNGVANIFMSWLRQLLFLLLNGRASDSFFVWFADYHSLIPMMYAKLFNIPSFVVLGGSDTTYMPEYNYGVFSNFLRSFSARYTIQNADNLLPVTSSLIDRARKHVSDIRGTVHVVPTGYDPRKWYCDTPKEDIVLTVSTFRNKGRMMIKGLDRFIAMAFQNPDYTFVLVGVSPASELVLRDFELPVNLQLVPPQKSEDLRKYYSRARYYAQLSRSEGLPNAVCEAILCECIPICTDVGGCRDLTNNIVDPDGEPILLRGFRDKDSGRVDYVKNKLSFSLREQKVVSLLRSKVSQ